MNGEFGIHKSFDDGTSDDYLLNNEIIRHKSVILDFTEFGSFFGLDFEADEVEIQREEFFDYNYIFGGGELFDAINNDADI